MTEAWVSYAVRMAEHGWPSVRRRELVNESYMRAYNGGATAVDYARDLSEWSRRLIRIGSELVLGANAPNGADEVGAADPEGAAPWWETVLSRSADAIGFLAIHEYPCWKWGSYDYYTRNAPRFTDVVDAAVDTLDRYCSAEDPGRIGIAITEMSSVDWLGHPQNLGWKRVNNLDHALVLVDVIGRHRSHPRLDMMDATAEPSADELAAPDNTGSTSTAIAIPGSGVTLP